MKCGIYFQPDRAPKGGSALPPEAENSLSDQTVDDAVHRKMNERHAVFRNLHDVIDGRLIFRKDLRAIENLTERIHFLTRARQTPVRISNRQEHLLLARVRLLICGEEIE
jgi:hypothetical protein